MEWLIAHEDELNKETPATGQSTSENKATPGASEQNAAPTDNQAPQKDDQSGPGGLNETAANMAARKKITVEEAQALIRERQASRLEEERKQAIEDEKKRRLAGQKMAETRAELQDQERIRLAQQIRREKLEKEMHRKQVLDQIARDREAMKIRSKAAESSKSSSETTPTKSATATGVATPKAAPTECRIALRFPDGSNLMQKFSPQEQLAAVRLFVQEKKALAAHGSVVEFIAPPNKKLTESMMSETLEKLGLCPASRLEVKFTQEVWSDLD